jgi:hypothetical protein
VPIEVEEYTPEGIDYGWVLQITFIVTILLGAPLVALLGIYVELPTWRDRAEFAIRVGAVLWFLTAIITYTYAKYTHV